MRVQQRLEVGHFHGIVSVGGEVVGSDEQEERGEGGGGRVRWTHTHPLTACSAHQSLQSCPEGLSGILLPLPPEVCTPAHRDHTRSLLYHRQTLITTQYLGVSSESTQVDLSSGHSLDWVHLTSTESNE